MRRLLRAGPGRDVLRFLDRAFSPVKQGCHNPPPHSGTDHPLPAAERQTVPYGVSPRASPLVPKTRRRFGALQRCAVSASFLDVLDLEPDVDCSARTDDSRPAPGPLMRTRVLDARAPRAAVPAA